MALQGVQRGGMAGLVGFAGLALLAVAIAGSAYQLYAYSKTMLVCYETNTTLADQTFVDIMIADIVKNGDHGGRAYPNKLAYLDDRTECCTLERITLNAHEGKPARREVSISAKYFNTALQDYVVIQRRFDACGHASAKPLTAG